MSDKKAVSKPQKIISAKDDILQALFERTFQNISPISKRIFLMLCGWRSYIPKIAIEAVLFRNEGPDVDPGYGLDELERMSLIESRVADDDSEFVGVPLTAAVFGIKKLATSPLKTAIENDIKFLQELGSTSSSSVGKGVAQKIRKLIGNIARQISSGKENYEDNRHLLEFIATRHNDSWLVIADLVEEIEQEGVSNLSQEYIRRFIEGGPSHSEALRAWERLAHLYEKENDVFAAVAAYANAYSASDTPYAKISNAANWLNKQIVQIGRGDVGERIAVFGPFIRLMESRIKEASARDLSRLRGFIYM